MEALAIPRYERPVLVWPVEQEHESPVVWWAVLVGFSFALAIAYATYCSHLGGDPDISFGWSGFKVTCRHS